MSVRKNKTVFHKAAEHKGTTVTGGIAAIAGVVFALIPSDVHKGCLDSILSSDNPVVVSGLVIVGLLLTVIGPSLHKRA